MLAALSSAIVFGRAPKNQHASATQAANLLLPNSIPRNGVTNLHSSANQMSTSNPACDQ